MSNYFNDKVVAVTGGSEGIGKALVVTKYHEKQLAGVESTYANPIIHCAPDADKVREALEKRLG